MFPPVMLLPMFSNCCERSFASNENPTMIVATITPASQTILKSGYGSAIRSSSVCNR